jgi:hypothetical protein
MIVSNRSDVSEELRLYLRPDQIDPIFVEKTTCARRLTKLLAI